MEGSKPTKISRRKISLEHLLLTSNTYMYSYFEFVAAPESITKYNESLNIKNKRKAKETKTKVHKLTSAMSEVCTCGGKIGITQANAETKAPTAVFDIDTV